MSDYLDEVNKTPTNRSFANADVYMSNSKELDDFNKPAMRIPRAAVKQPSEYQAETPWGGRK
jgi:hypothetical protein